MSRRLALLLALVASLVAGPVRAEGPRRFAVVVGNDHGGAGTERLRYAQADARRMRDLLVRLGGVAPDDAALVLDGEARDLWAALDTLGARAAHAAAGGRPTVLLLYYSGHAKDRALRLGDTAVPLDLLSARLREVPATVRIGIVDACRSGGIRTKGARRAPAFEVHSPSASAQGLVLLTSSAADEDSQESDHLGGSYFTHYLATGLMGEADRSLDGRVTLAEAYAYAYERTVAETAATLAGPQHPTFAYDLSGAGDVVLTDLDRPEGLVLPAEAPAGAYWLVREGRVVAEVAKPAGAARRVALAPGTYTVKRRLGDRLRLGTVRVAAGRPSVLDEADLRDAPFADDPVKGAGRAPHHPPRWGLTAASQGFFTGSDLFPNAALVGAETELAGIFGPPWRLGLDAAVGGREARLALEGLAPLAYRYRGLHLGVSLLHDWPGHRITPFAGARLGWIMLSRDFSDPAWPDQFFSTVSPGVVAGLRLRLAGPVSLAARGRLHYLHYNVDEDRSLGWWELGLAVVLDP